MISIETILDEYERLGVELVAIKAKKNEIAAKSERIAEECGPNHDYAMCSQEYGWNKARQQELVNQRDFLTRLLVEGISND